MSISPTSNYMSNAEILEWMQDKTGDMYANMSSAMSSADRNGDAEAALNKIRGDIANTKVGSDDGIAIRDEVNAALHEYGDVPGVKDALQPIANKLNADYATPQYTPAEAWANAVNNAAGRFGVTVPVAVGTAPPVVKISSDEVDSWTKSIDNTVSDLGKSDQLALINIQEMNSEINQAKQTASALMDSANKSSNDIISHIG
jgi:hypothetical protein